MISLSSQLSTVERETREGQGRGKRAGDSRSRVSLVSFLVNSLVGASGDSTGGWGSIFRAEMFLLASEGPLATETAGLAPSGSGPTQLLDLEGEIN